MVTRFLVVSVSFILLAITGCAGPHIKPNEEQTKRWQAANEAIGEQHAESHILDAEENAAAWKQVNTERGNRQQEIVAAELRFRKEQAQCWRHPRAVSIRGRCEIPPEVAARPVLQQPVASSQSTQIQAPQNKSSIKSKNTAAASQSAYRSATKTSQIALQHDQHAHAWDASGRRPYTPPAYINHRKGTTYSMFEDIPPGKNSVTPLSKAGLNTMLQQGATVEDITRAFWADVPIMTTAAFCESTFRQWDTKGKVLSGKKHALDKGVMQINIKVHGTELRTLGLDVAELYDNLLFARTLYNRNGVSDWSASYQCMLRKHDEITNGQPYVLS